MVRYYNFQVSDKNPRDISRIFLFRQSVFVYNERTEVKKLGGASELKEKKLKEIMGVDLGRSCSNYSSAIYSLLFICTYHCGRGLDDANANRW